MKRVLSNEAKEFILANYMLISGIQISKKIGFSKNAVQRFLKINSLKVPPEVMKKWKSSCNLRIYSETEKKFIIDNLKTQSVKSIAKELNTGLKNLNAEIRSLGLWHIVEARKVSTQIKPGNIPPNKGKKIEEYMTKAQIANFKNNSFKKGNIPHNALPDFSEVSRTYKDGSTYIMIKVPGVRKLQLKNRYIWEKHNSQKLPKGHNVVFKDGNRTNFDPENLECVSNEELMKRNSIYNYPEEIRELVQLKGAITRQINKKRKK